MTAEMHRLLFQMRLSVLRVIDYFFFVISCHAISSKAEKDLLCPKEIGFSSLGTMPRSEERTILN